MMPIDGRLLLLTREVQRARVLCAYAAENLVQARRELSKHLAYLKSIRKGHHTEEGASWKS